MKQSSHRSFLIVAPPLMQLNTSYIYSATIVLKGFLQEHGHRLWQADLGIEPVDTIFTPAGLQRRFDDSQQASPQFSKGLYHTYRQRQRHVY